MSSKHALPMPHREGPVHTIARQTQKWRMRDFRAYMHLTLQGIRAIEKASAGKPASPGLRQARSELQIHATEMGKRRADTHRTGA